MRDPSTTERAGVPFEPVVFAKNADVLAAAQSGTVDTVFTNATPARMNEGREAAMPLVTGFVANAGRRLRACRDAGSDPLL